MEGEQHLPSVYAAGKPESPVLLTPFDRKLEDLVLTDP